jgi:hypothetical protein
MKLITLAGFIVAVSLGVAAPASGAIEIRTLARSST